MSNPYEWLTHPVFANFAQEVGLNLWCSKCVSMPKNYYCDTGNDDGYVPRSSSFNSTAEGFVNMSDSRHVPVVRITCMHCGHMDFYSMFAVAKWREAKLRREGNAMGSLFGLGDPNG